MTESDQPNGTQISYPCPICMYGGPHDVISEVDALITIKCGNDACSQVFEVQT